MLETRWCAECAAEVEFARFDCADHRDDCVELACVHCGAGVETTSYRVAGSPAAAMRVDSAA